MDTASTFNGGLYFCRLPLQLVSTRTRFPSGHCKDEHLLTVSYYYLGRGLL
jgi:hypothetical protein